MHLVNPNARIPVTFDDTRGRVHYINVPTYSTDLGISDPPSRVVPAEDLIAAVVSVVWCLTNFFFLSHPRLLPALLD